MKEYNWENRVSMDRCALVAKERENESIVEYNTYNFFTNEDYERRVKELNAIAWENQNLRFRHGYGIANEQVVDEDSRARYGADRLTHGPERRQYNTRNFMAVPDFSKGGCAPNTEMWLKTPMDTHDLKQCDRVAEKAFDRFVPFNDCMKTFITNGARAIPELHAIGSNSRDMIRNSNNKCRA